MPYRENTAVPGRATTGASPPPAPVAAGLFATNLESSRFPRSWIAAGVLVAIVLSAVAFVGVRSIFRGRVEAEALAAHLHDEMHAKDWDGIYNGAAWAYRSNTSEEDSRELFEAISRKIGDVHSCKQLTTVVNVTPTGSYITARFDTVFSGDVHAEETMVWQSYGAGYRLVSYNINSLALLTR